MEDELENWHRCGYVILERVLSADEVVAALEDAFHYLPRPDDYRRDSAKYIDMFELGGNWVHRTFPFRGTLNRLAVHPTLVSFAESALGSTGLMMSQCELIGKYGGRQYDQELHTDYDNNTLAFPGNDLVEVNMITYLTEVTEDLGPTFVVSREDTGDGTDSRQYCPRKDFPKLYQQEIPVTVPAGSTLIYTMRTVHRGSAMRAHQGFRVTFHMGYRLRRCYWTGASSWHRYGATQAMNEFLEQATPRQRELLGFPPAGDDYWNEETLAGVAQRYPGMDLAPYRAASSARPSAN